MMFIEELLLILGLSMDGFAASVCLGIELGRSRVPPVVLAITACHVGMLLMGYLVGSGVRGVMEGIFLWIAAALLSLLGIHMLRAADREEPRRGGETLSIAALAFATSIDAVTVGVALALMGTSALLAAGMTAAVMGTLSLSGALLGGRIGKKYRLAARAAGGAILMLLGIKLFLGAAGLI